MAKYTYDDLKKVQSQVKQYSDYRDKAHNVSTTLGNLAVTDSNSVLSCLKKAQEYLADNGDWTDEQATACAEVLKKIIKELKNQTTEVQTMLKQVETVYSQKSSEKFREYQEVLDNLDDKGKLHASYDYYTGTGIAKK